MLALEDALGSRLDAAAVMLLQAAPAPAANKMSCRGCSIMHAICTASARQGSQPALAAAIAAAAAWSSREAMSHLLTKLEQSVTPALGLAALSALAVRQDAARLAVQCLAKRPMTGHDLKVRLARRLVAQL